MTTRRSARCLQARPASTLLLLTLCAAAAHAQSSGSSPYYIGASQTVGRESNLLRLADGQEAPAGYSRADTILSTALLAGLDQPFGRQRGYGNLTVRSNRYDKNSVFNNQSYAASAGLDWSTVERLSGSFYGSANRSLQRFNTEEIGFLGQKNLESTSVVGAKLSLGLVTQYALELNGSHRRVRNSLDRADVKSRNFDQDNASLGLRWKPSSATSFGLATALSRGRYPQFRTLANGEFEADRFERRDISVSATFQPSGASMIDARMSNGKTRYDLNEKRDFSGVTGNITWNWQASGKVRLATTLARDTGQDSYAVSLFGLPATSDYSRVSNSLRVQADYQASAKVSFSTGLSYYDRSIVRTIENPFIPLDANGRERQRLLNLSARWTPVRNAMVGCDLGSERQRGSGELTTNLHGSSINCYGQLTLQ